MDVDPDLAYEAAEASRLQAGENVIAAIGAQITELKAENWQDLRSLKIKAELVHPPDPSSQAEIKTQGLPALMICGRVIWRVIWPLIVLLAGTSLRTALPGSHHCLCLRSRISRSSMQPRPAVLAHTSTIGVILNWP